MDIQIQSNSHHLSADDCASAQQAIDSEIKAIPLSPSPSSESESVRKLCAQRNAYALINAWFPAELMVAIFCEIVTTSRLTEPFFGGIFAGFNFSRVWIVIIHVCQRWRTIAIGASRLWEGICFANAEITAFMLRCSAALPISIDYRSWYGPHEPSMNALSLALSHSDRAFEVFLTLPPKILQDLVSRYLSTPMPFLKRLELEIGHREEDRRCFLPPGCLEGTNCLLRLVLLGVSISSQSILPTTLTQMVLCNLPEKFTVLQMLVLLEPLENLRDLSIENALAGSGLSGLYRLSPRPHFRRLRISAAADECTDFIRLFPITSATQATLHSFHPHPVPVHPYAAVVPPFLAEVQHLRFGQLLGPVYGVPGLLRGLSISYLLEEVRVEAYVGASLPAVPSELCFSVSVTPRSNTPTGAWHELLHDLCAHMQLDSVEAVAIVSDYILAWDEELAKITARILASQFHGVHMLSVSITAMKYLLRVMHPRDDRNGPAFPRLRALKVDGPYYSREEERELVISIADCLIARKGADKVADVEELVFHNKIVPLEYVEDLERLKRWEPPVRDHKDLGPFEQCRWSWSRECYRSHP